MSFDRIVCGLPRLAPALWVALLGFLPACTDGPRPTGPRLVVLYSTCTLSKDFLSPYRPGIEFTPRLQAFADEGLVLERHNTEAGQSGVAFASIYSGVQADRHGVYHHPRHLPEELYLATEAFGDNGYRPYFWSGQSLASAELAYGQGVDEEDVFHTHVMFTPEAKELPESFFVATTANGPELDLVLERLHKDPEAAAFLQINFTITHELYHEYADLEKIEAFRAEFPGLGPDLTREELAATLELFEANRHRLQFDHPEAVKDLGLSAADVARLDAVLRLVYAACVHQLDGYFGRFLDRIDAAGLTDDSLVVLTADHGETFYLEDEPLHWTHGLQLAPSVIEVPLVLRGAGLVPGRYPGVTRSTDVLPTLAGLCDLRLPLDVAFDGVDLSTALRGEREPLELLAFSHTSTLGEPRVKRYRRENYRVALEILPEPSPEHMWVRVRAGDRVWEQRRTEPGPLRTVSFDLAADPGRSTDLYDPDDPEQREMARRLERYRRRLIDAFSDEEAMSQREILDRLRGLGYVGGE